MSLKAFIATVAFLFSTVVSAETVEVVTFKSKENTTPEQVIASANKMKATLQSWEGFISRELIQVDSNHWIDIVHWDNMASAQAAIKNAEACEACLDFFMLLDETSQQLQHGEKVLAQ